MIEETLFERFYIVLWKTKQGGTPGSWHFIVKDMLKDKGFVGHEEGTTKAAFNRARAAARRWAMSRYNRR